MFICTVGCGGGAVVFISCLFEKESAAVPVHSLFYRMLRLLHLFVFALHSPFLSRFRVPGQKHCIASDVVGRILSLSLSLSLRIIKIGFMGKHHHKIMCFAGDFAQCRRVHSNNVAYPIACVYLFALQREMPIHQRTMISWEEYVVQLGLAWHTIVRLRLSLFNLCEIIGVI